MPRVAGDNVDVLVVLRVSTNVRKRIHRLGDLYEEGAREVRGARGAKGARVGWGGAREARGAKGARGTHI